MENKVENVKFEEARKHLASLSDDELKARFWQLAEEVVEPMLEMGKNIPLLPLSALFCCVWVFPQLRRQKS